MANTNTVTGVTEAFINAYTAGYEHVLQEKKFYWGSSMRMEAITGENQSYDFLGSIELTERGERYADVPIEELTHNRRWIYPRFFGKGVYVDDLDKIAEHTDPTSDYMQALIKGAIRVQNNIGTGAFFSSVAGGKTPTANTYSYENTAIDTSGTGRTIPHDATDDGAAGGTSTGLTIEKLQLAQQALWELDNDPDEVIWAAISPKQHRDLLRQAETQSIDTSNFKSLALGRVGDFMGFKFIITNQVVKGYKNDIDGNTSVYEVPVWCKEGMLFALHRTPVIKVDWLPTKQCWQIYASVGANAMRMDEDKVLKIECI